MPAWPGGPCPNCGEDMPENLIHCQSCRSLLNDDLDPDSVHIPAFQPLQEVESMVEVEPAGYFVECPHCDRELRFRKKYLGNKVLCKYCDGTISLDLSTSTFTAFFVDCPHCYQELRSSMKYLGQKVGCKHCSGHLHFIGE